MKLCIQINQFPLLAREKFKLAKISPSNDVRRQQQLHQVSFVVKVVFEYKSYSGTPGSSRNIV
jgi:hypothetical protein